MYKMYMVANIVRALRLPFIAASILPFVFGSLIRRQHFNLAGFLLGLVAVAATHLSANLINDYADSKSGVDWQDRNFYQFFGGSKLIQENVFSERFYLQLAVFFAIISGLSVVLLAINLNNLSVLAWYLVIIFLGWQYSAKPLQFSYHRLGEAVIFLLFGPALVAGGYFIQTMTFPALDSFLLSLPFGFLTTAILFTNEIPDAGDDIKAGKLTWVSFSGIQRAFLLYYLLVLFAFLSILLNVALGYLNPFAFFALIFMVPAYKAANILKQYPGDKVRLIQSSKLTIASQAGVSVILIVSAVI